ncbi:MAG: hypothetical protein ACOYM3_11895 [Terrimicrobiaceae bacterium]
MFHHVRSLALLASISIAPILRAENHVQNPGFEDGIEGWRLFLPPPHEGANVQWTAVNDDPHSGAACLSMTIDEPIRCAIPTKRSFKVLPGEKYRVQAWVKFAKDARIEPGNPGAYIRATLFEDRGQSTTDPLGNIHIGLNGDVARSPSTGQLNVQQLPAGWQKIEAVIEIPANDTESLDVALFSQGVTGTVFWDDVAFELVDPKTPLTKVLE